MINVYLNKMKDGSYYFSLVYENIIEVNYSSCKAISSFLKTPLEEYNDLLLKKVIRHDNYKACTINEQKTLDITFFLNDESKETYIESFKETFAPQLTLLALRED